MSDVRYEDLPKTAREAIDKGLVKIEELGSCPDCAAQPGAMHEPGCDVVRCSHCGTQLLGCRCGGALHIPGKARWEGLWPGEIECRERGWMIGPIPDLNRLTAFQITGRDLGENAGYKPPDRGLS